VTSYRWQHSDTFLYGYESLFGIVDAPERWRKRNISLTLKQSPSWREREKGFKKRVWVTEEECSRVHPSMAWGHFGILLGNMLTCSSVTEGGGGGGGLRHTSITTGSSLAVPVIQSSKGRGGGTSRGATLTAMWEGGSGHLRRRGRYSLERICRVRG